MVNKKYLIYKCSYIKVDIGIKKSNKVKVRGSNKNGINEKSSKRNRERLIKLI